MRDFEKREKGTVLLNEKNDNTGKIIWEVSLIFNCAGRFTG